jgi:hypothetical protein
VESAMWTVVGGRRGAVIKGRNGRCKQNR